MDLKTVSGKGKEIRRKTMTSFFRNYHTTITGLKNGLRSRRKVLISSYSDPSIDKIYMCEREG